MYGAVDACIAEVALFTRIAVVPHSEHQCIITLVVVKSVLHSVTSVRYAEILNSPVERSGKTCACFFLTREVVCLYKIFGRIVPRPVFVRSTAFVDTIASKFVVCSVQSLDGKLLGHVVCSYILLMLLHKFCKRIYLFAAELTCIIIRLQTHLLHFLFIDADYLF